MANQVCDNFTGRREDGIGPAEPWRTCVACGFSKAQHDLPKLSSDPTDCLHNAMRAMQANDHRRATAYATIGLLSFAIGAAEGLRDYTKLDAG